MATTANYKPILEVAADAEDLAYRTIDTFVADAHRAITAKDSFYLAISGGHTPKRFFELLPKVPKAKSLPWHKIQLFWVDERYVAPDSPSSNYRLAAETFLSKVAIPDRNIHRIPTGYDDIREAARCYEDTIREVFGLKENQVPEFDLIVLGMGSEGHTGSLFPDSYVPFDMENLASAVYFLDDKHNRITLTHPVLCAARHLVVLVSGKEKAGILKEVLTSEPDDVRYPIHVLWPILDKVTWLVDRDAAKAI